MMMNERTETIKNNYAVKHLHHHTTLNKKKPHKHYKKRPPKLPHLSSNSNKQNKISPTFNDSPTKRGKWVVEDDINNDMLILSPESVDNTSTTSINIFNKNNAQFDDEDCDDDDNNSNNIYEEEDVYDEDDDYYNDDDEDNDNWMEEWGAVTIQSLFRGHHARKRVKRLKKRMLKVKQMRKHRRHRKKHNNDNNNNNNSEQQQKRRNNNHEKRKNHNKKKRHRNYDNNNDQLGKQHRRRRPHHHHQQQQQNSNNNNNNINNNNNNINTNEKTSSNDDNNNNIKHVNNNNDDNSIVKQFTTTNEKQRTNIMIKQKQQQNYNSDKQINVKQKQLSNPSNVNKKTSPSSLSPSLRPSTATVRDALAQLSIIRRKNNAKSQIFVKHANEKAVVIQKIFRGYYVRLNFIKKLRIKLEIEKTKEKLFELNQIKEKTENTAAVDIQRMMRGKLGRKQLVIRRRDKKKQHENKSAIKIQSLVRGYQCRCGIIDLVEKLTAEEENKEKEARQKKIKRQKLRIKHKHARQIQKIYRGYNVRANLSKIITNNATRVDAAVGKDSNNHRIKEQHECREDSTSPPPASLKNNLFIVRNNSKKNNNIIRHRSKTTSPQPLMMKNTDHSSKFSPSSKNHKRKRRAPQVLLTTAMLKSQNNKTSNCNSNEDSDQTMSSSPSPPPLITHTNQNVATIRQAPKVKSKKKSSKQLLVTSPVAMIDVGANSDSTIQHKQQSPKSAAIQKKKEAKARFEHRARINPMVDEPVYDFESLLSGLWEGESLDNHGHVTTIFDCVLRFYKDTSNGQAMIEGRAKTRSGNDVGVIIMQGVFDWGSSRCILVVEGKNCQGGYTYMGWLSPPTANGSVDNLSMSSTLPTDVPLSPTTSCIPSNANFETSGHGVGYTLEASFQQSMLHLKKKSNTRRSEMRPIRQLINNARSRANIGRPSSNDRTSSAKKLLGSIVTTPEKRVEKMMTDVSAMLSNFKYQMEAVERQRTAMRRDNKNDNNKKTYKTEAVNANSSEEINSIVALMTELEAKLPTVQQRLLLSSSDSNKMGGSSTSNKSIWSPNFIRGNSKESNRAKSSKMNNHLGLGTLETNVRTGSSSSNVSNISSRLSAEFDEDFEEGDLSSSPPTVPSSSRESSPTSESEQQSRTVTPIQSHYKHLFSGDRQPHEYGVHWKSSASPINLVSKIRRRTTPGMFLAPMNSDNNNNSNNRIIRKKKKVSSSSSSNNNNNHHKNMKQHRKRLSSSQRRNNNNNNNSSGKSGKKRSSNKEMKKYKSTNHHSGKKLHPPASASVANSDKTMLKKETSNLLGKLKIRNKVLEAEAAIKRRREKQYQIDEEKFKKMTQHSKRNLLTTVEEYDDFEGW